MRRFDEYNPISVTVYFLAVIAVAMFSMNPVLLAISLVGSVAVCCMLGGARIREHVFSFVLFVILAVLNPIFSHNGATVLFVMNDNPVTLEALLYGICVAVMIVSVLYWFRAFTTVMTSDRLLYIFSALSPKLSLVLTMALRFVPLLVRRYREVELSQRALGLYRDENVIDSIRGKLRVLSILITWALEGGIVTADSMEARAYGTRRRSRYAIFRFTVYDGVLLILSAVLCALSIGALLDSSFAYYPRIIYSAGTYAVFGYIAYGILCLIPVMIHAEEAVRWKYLVSRT